MCCAVLCCSVLSCTGLDCTVLYCTPKSKYVASLSVLSQISNCQGLGRKNKHDILKADRTGMFAGARARVSGECMHAVANKAETAIIDIAYLSMCFKLFEYVLSEISVNPAMLSQPSLSQPSKLLIWMWVRPVHLLRVSLLRVLESNFPGDSL